MQLCESIHTQIIDADKSGDAATAKGSATSNDNSPAGDAQQLNKNGFRMSYSKRGENGFGAGDIFGGLKSVSPLSISSDLYGSMSDLGSLIGDSA